MHAEHEYNEGHGAQDKSHIVSLFAISSANFCWTPGMDCLVMKYMSVYVYGKLSEDGYHAFI